MASSAGRGVAFLDDAEELAIGVSHDPAVAGRVALRGQHGDGVADHTVAGDERAQRLAAQQRHVAIGHDDGSRDDADGFRDHPHGVASPELLFLHDDPRFGRLAGYLRAHLIPAVTDDDHELFGDQLTGYRQRVPEQSTPA